MNRSYSEYSFLQRRQVFQAELADARFGWDRFVSVYNRSDRVREVFRNVKCAKKHWLSVPEYGCKSDESGPCVESYISDCTKEDECILGYFDKHPIAPNEHICIDITGWIRPHLLFGLWYLWQVAGVKKVDLLYTEPMRYERGEQTQFSDEVVTEVRQVRGFEGAHGQAADKDLLIVGCGYDHLLLEHVANHKSRARKIQIFPFPPLRPHMYQEGRVRAELAKTAFGAVDAVRFAPACDPFMTAEVLREVITQHGADATNIYLAPLATKPQVVGFGLYYLRECMSRPVSLIFPYTNSYSESTSVGTCSMWLYRLDFDFLKKCQ